MLLCNDSEISVEEIKESYSKTTDIEFVSYANYDPKCNLCPGILTLRINSKEATFGRNAKYPDFFSPAECISETERNRKSINSKGWNVDVAELPKEYQPYANQIHELLNKHMPKDFCIGCD